LEFLKICNLKNIVKTPKSGSKWLGVCDAFVLGLGLGPYNTPIWGLGCEKFTKL